MSLEETKICVYKKEECQRLPTSRRGEKIGCSFDSDLIHMEDELRGVEKGSG